MIVVDRRGDGVGYNSVTVEAVVESGTSPRSPRMFSGVRTSVVPFVYRVVLFALLSSTSVPRSVDAVFIHGTESSYVRYPRWNSCPNASLSFEFRTAQPEGLLLYADDGGLYDFFEISHSGGSVAAILNIVDGRDSNVEMRIGRNVNDGQWHRVELRRNRMETTMLVDGVQDSSFSFGSNFNFGGSSLQNNSFVYVGGLPVSFSQTLHALSLPSVVFKPRFKGHVRNVMYGNCTCLTVRASPLDGVGYSAVPAEACDVRNNCTKGCVCISVDAGSKCDCSEEACIAGRSRSEFFV